MPRSIGVVMDPMKINIALARACMTDGDLAEKSGLPATTIHNIKARRSTRPATAGKIAKALGVDVTELLKDS